MIGVSGIGLPTTQSGANGKFLVFGVGRDFLLPCVSMKNPQLPEGQNQGAEKEELEASPSIRKLRN